jgi:hypothetical protein
MMICVHSTSMLPTPVCCHYYYSMATMCVHSTSCCFMMMCDDDVCPSSLHAAYSVVTIVPGENIYRNVPVLCCLPTSLLIVVC